MAEVAGLAFGVIPMLTLLAKSCLECYNVPENIEGFGSNYNSFLRDLDTERLRLKHWVEAWGLGDPVTASIATKQQLVRWIIGIATVLVFWRKLLRSLEILRPCTQITESKWMQMRAPPLNHRPVPRMRRPHLQRHPKVNQRKDSRSRGEEGCANISNIGCL